MEMFAEWKNADCHDRHWSGVQQGAGNWQAAMILE
jgi:hypothetical protein